MPIKGHRLQQFSFCRLVRPLREGRLRGRRGRKRGFRPSSTSFRPLRMRRPHSTSTSPPWLFYVYLSPNLRNSWRFYRTNIRRFRHSASKLQASGFGWPDERAALLPHCVTAARQELRVSGHVTVEKGLRNRDRRAGLRAARNDTVMPATVPTENDACFQSRSNEPHRHERKRDLFHLRSNEISLAQTKGLSSRIEARARHIGTNPRMEG